MAIAKNTVSRQYTGTTTFEPNNNRTYFFITMVDGSATISFGIVSPGETVGEIPLQLGEHYQPPICPTGEIRITTAATFVVHMG
jgi:hypothetical protein